MKCQEHTRRSKLWVHHPLVFRKPCKAAIADAAKTVRHIAWFEVVEQRGSVKGRQGHGIPGCAEGWIQDRGDKKTGCRSRIFWGYRNRERGGSLDPDSGPEEFPMTHRDAARLGLSVDAGAPHEEESSWEGLLILFRRRRKRTAGERLGICSMPPPSSSEA